MTPAIAVRAAGADAHLVARPHGAVVHLSTSPLSPSGRFIPRAGRTVCRARTGRLHVLGPPEDVRRHRRMCARCTARLSLRLTSSRDRRATQSTREQWRDRFAGLTLEQLLDDLPHAHVESDVDEVLHLALLLHEPRAVVAAAGTVQRHRARLHVPSAVEDLAAAEVREHREAATARRKADRKEVHKLREARIGRLGINNAVPTRGAPLR